MGSITHVTMLGDCGILREEESLQLQNELKQLHREIELNPELLTRDFEEFHSFVVPHND